jgi:hypothetical protein
MLAALINTGSKIQKYPWALYFILQRAKQLILHP